jgi:adenine-specific DNA-methyltransferase
MDEVFGAENFISLIPFRKKTMPFGTTFIEQMADFLVWYGKRKFTDNGVPSTKFYPLFLLQDIEGEFHHCWYEMPDGSRHRMSTEQLNNHSLLPKGARVYRLKSLEPSGPMESGMFTYTFEGKRYPPPKNGYGTPPEGMDRLRDHKRLQPEGNRLTFIMYADENAWTRMTAPWTDTVGADNKRYVVQTNSIVVQRCVLMTTDPGDIVFDPTCGSGTTAYVAEKCGRRWITCDTSRVAINVARKNLLSSVFEHYKTQNGVLASGFIYEKVKRITLGSLANDLEPGEIELRNKPEVEKGTIRVGGPFEVMSLGRYSVEDWKGYVIGSGAAGDEPAKLENYIEVVARLYRKNAAVQGASGLIHAIAESHNEKIAISLGPLSGRVTAKQVNDAVQDALASGILEVHILGWAFESNVGEVKAQLERRGKIKVELIMIRPDTLAEGLRIVKPEDLFSPLALPDIEVAIKKNGKQPQAVVHLKGVAVFDRKNRTTDYKRTDSGYVSAWYLDEDYDGDCFVDCQMFFDFKKAPTLKALGVDVEPEEYKLRTESHPFPARGYKRIAVKVVDVFGNESTVVREL